MFGQEYKKKDYMCILLALDQKEKKKKPVIIKDCGKGTKILVKTKTKS